MPGATVAALNGAPLLRVLGSIAGTLSVFGSLIIVTVFGPRMRELYTAPSTCTSHEEVRWIGRTRAPRGPVCRHTLVTRPIFVCGHIVRVLWARLRAW